MSGCAFLAFVPIALTISLSATLPLGWFLGCPIAGLIVAPIYWVLLIIYSRLGMRLIMNVGVTTAFAGMMLMWVEWRRPACIAMEKFINGKEDLAFSILHRDLRSKSEALDVMVQYELGYARLDIGEMRAAISRVREEGNSHAASFEAVGRAEIVALFSTESDAVSELNDDIVAMPINIRLLLIRGRVVVAGYKSAAAEADFRSIVEICNRLSYVWVSNPSVYVESRLVAAQAYLGLGYVEIGRGNIPEAREWLRRAIAEFGHGNLARDACSRNTFIFRARGRMVGNLVYAWATGLAVHAGDPKDAAAVETLAKAVLGKSRRDLRGFVESHLRANTIPTLWEEAKAVRDAAKL